MSHGSAFVFFNDTATTEIYTLSLHDALPISIPATLSRLREVVINPSSWKTHVTLDERQLPVSVFAALVPMVCNNDRSEEHTSELQSRQYLVCRLLLEKKNNRVSMSSLQAARC